MSYAPSVSNTITFTLSPSGPIPTVLSLALSAQDASNITFTGVLADDQGNGLAGKQIALYMSVDNINFILRQVVTTTAGGAFTATSSTGNLAIGTYYMRAAYDGN